MPPMNLPGVRIFGRPFKPVAFGFTMSLLVLFWAGWYDRGALDGTFWGDLVGCAAFGIAATLSAAWWFRSQRWSEYGLLATFVLYFWYSFTVSLVNLEVNVSGLIGLCLAVIAGGSWLLERADPLTPSKG